MKILITGNVASGKTTLSKILSEYYEIERFEIDEIVHDIDNNDIKRSLKEQTKIINRINKENKNYILEGVLRKNLDFIINLVDQIIYLNIDKKEISKRINKYPKKLIIIKNKKELKKYLESIYKNGNYIE